MTDALSIASTELAYFVTQEEGVQSHPSNNVDDE